ncbi:hypothetical protein KP509_19G063900 [Ceratopteris richardii]|uniref:Uncharacterized protein n=1 Tax=Ceratopteris richardii TaxID=49495 RepID=A0A8T2SPJ2_CERRI|nr:hypothetical protein KP509_19G063900 [Ceratopteris richardii]
MCMRLEHTIVHEEVTTLLCSIHREVSGFVSYEQTCFTLLPLFFCIHLQQPSPAEKCGWISELLFWWHNVSNQKNQNSTSCLSLSLSLFPICSKASRIMERSVQK